MIKAILLPSANGETGTEGRGEMNAKHTPGPWETLPTKTCKGILIQGRGTGGVYFTLATVAGPSNNTAAALDSLIANARLIAAAPDLLEACKRALAVLEKEPACQIYSAHAQIVRAAIAKATAS